MNEALYRTRIQVNYADITHYDKYAQNHVP